MSVTTEKKQGGISKLFRGHAGAATMAGVLEIAFFHPFDTVAKRLMSNRSSLRGSTFGETAHNLNTTIFKKNANASVATKIMYLYPGSLYAVFYKVLQRVYKFAGQPIVRDFINANYKEPFQRMFGSKSRLMSESVAGCLIGIGEVVLLPLDRLKILSQTNEAAMKDGVVSLIRKEGIRGMYAGTVVTMTRNAPGSFFLFGGTAFAKDVVFKLEDYTKATFFQNMCASTVGACLSITMTNPMDVIKTRIQNQEASSREGGARVIGRLLKEEGPTAFFKGLTPKVVASAPKLIFAYTMTEFFLQMMGAKKK